jgi:hypothetical protein
MWRSLLPIVLLLGCGSPELGPAEAPRTREYKGWREALTLQASAAGITLTSIPEAGGRIIHYAQAGENILFENPDYLGKTLAGTKPGVLDQGYIGYNIDLGPELRRIPPHLSLWMGPFTWGQEEGSVYLESSPDSSVGIQIRKRMRLHPTTGELSLSQTMKNVSSLEQSYCLWDRTLCRGGGFAFVPLARKSRFSAGWSLLRDGAYRGDDASHPNVEILDGVLVAHAVGTSSKIGLDSDAGWIAYVRGRLLFIKYFPHFPSGPYTDGGNSVEIYFDPKVCELEPLSPEVKLRPGQSYEFPERWKLLTLDHEVTCAREARALLDRIPPSPFGR